MASKLRVTFWDPTTGKRVPAHNADTGAEVWGGQWHPNMITDVGLDNIALKQWRGTTASFVTLRGYLRLAGGMPEIKEPSGAVHASQTGTTVTATAGFFLASDVGKAIVWADGSNARITSFTNATSVEVDKPQNVAAQAFERWHVDISSIPGGVTHPTGTIPSGSTFTERDQVGGFWIFRSGMSHIVTLDNNANVNGVVLTDGNNAVTGDPNIIECIRDANGTAITVSMLAGKAVRVDSVMEGRAPVAAKNVSLQIDEYDAGNQLIDTNSIDADFWLTHAAASDTNTQGIDSLFNALDPNQSGLLQYARLLDSANHTPGARIPGTAGFPANPSGTQTHVSEYVPGTRRLTKEATIPAASSVGAAHGFAFPYRSGTIYAGGPVLQFRDGATFTKEDTHTLRVGFEIHWDRDYTV